MKYFLAVFVSLVLIAVAPGVGPYQVLAQFKSAGEVREVELPQSQAKPGAGMPVPFARAGGSRLFRTSLTYPQVDNIRVVENISNGYLGMSRRGLYTRSARLPGVAVSAPPVFNSEKIGGLVGRREVRESLISIRRNAGPEIAAIQRQRSIPGESAFGISRRIFGFLIGQGERARVAALGVAPGVVEERNLRSADIQGTLKPAVRDGSVGPREELRISKSPEVPLKIASKKAGGNSKRSGSEHYVLWTFAGTAVLLLVAAAVSMVGHSGLGFSAVLGQAAIASSILGLIAMLGGASDLLKRFLPKRLASSDLSSDLVFCGTILVTSAIAILAILVGWNLWRSIGFYPFEMGNIVGISFASIAGGLPGIILPHRLPNPDAFFVHAYKEAEAHLKTELEKTRSKDQPAKQLYFVSADANYLPQKGELWKFRFHIAQSPDSETADVIYVDFYQNILGAKGHKVRIPDDPQVRDSSESEYYVDSSVLRDFSLGDKDYSLPYRADSVSSASAPLIPPDEALGQVRDRVKDPGGSISISLRAEKDERQLWRLVYRLQGRSRGATVSARRPMVSDEDIDKAIKLAINDKTSENSEQDYHMTRHNLAQNLLNRGATDAQIDRLYQLSDEAPITGSGHFSNWTND